MPADQGGKCDPVIVPGTERSNPSVEDAVLVRAALRGDEHAYAQLVQRYLRKAVAAALEYTTSLADAEDVAQDTFIRVYQQLHRFDAARPFAPWFFTVLRNTARNAARHRRRHEHEHLDREYASASRDPLRDLEREQLRRKIEAAIEQLPRMQAACFRLCLVEGLTSVEAGSVLDLSESTVRVHVFRARSALRNLLLVTRNAAND